MTTTPTLWRAEQQANTTDSGAGGDDQSEIQLVGLADGTFIALWESNTDVGAGSTAGTDIIGQRYDAEGNKVGGEFRTNTTFSDDEGDFTAVALPNGNFVLVYEDSNASGTSIRFDVRNAAGGFVNFGTILADPGADLLGDPVVTVAADSSFLVAFTRDEGALVSTQVVKVSNTGSVGAPAGAFGGSDTGFQNDAATLTNGNFVVVSRVGAADDSIRFRLVNAAGAPIGSSAFVANTGSNGDTDSAPSVAALTGGGFVVAWQNADANDTDVQFQRFTAAGATVGGVVAVNGGIADDKIAPDVIGLPDGGFVIVYDDNADGAVKLQRFTAGGAEVGAEVTVGDLLNDFRPAVSLADDGRLLVGWSTLVNTGPFAADVDVRFSILDPRENVINGGNTSEQITSRIDGATVNGNFGDDTLFGQAAADTLNGGVGDDVLLGRGGDDILRGGSGIDTVDGGLGNDIIKVFDNEIGDHAAGGLGTDLLDLSALAFRLAVVDLDANIWTIRNPDNSLFGPILSISTVENVDGTQLGDTITGNVVSNVLNGNGGDDALAGGLGNDTLDGGAGDDVMAGGGGNDTYVISAAGDSVTEGSNLGTDTVRTPVDHTLARYVENLEMFGAAAIDGIGNAGGNTMTGNGAANILTGLGGSDRLDGGLDADQMIGGAGDDIYWVDETGDEVVEVANEGSDQVRAGVSFTLGNLAHVENLQLIGTGAINGTGNAGANALIGGIGNNALNGQAGDDTLDGGLGRDSMTGGTGADTFVYINSALQSGITNTTRDLIQDLVSGTDMLDLSLMDANLLAAGDQAFAIDADGSFSTGELKIEDIGTDLLLSFNIDADAAAEMQIQLRNINSVGAGDFVL